MSVAPIAPPVTNPNLQICEFTDELASNFLTYAEYVIRDRAIPDVRDGLKPVHRRILWTMWDMGCKNALPPKKSARIVGEVIGKYHPHGDSAAYDSMVRMAQSFSMSNTLVQGKGNFGSIDGDRAAAYRYTEAKLSAFGQHVLFSDINDDTVDFVNNYTNEFKEPVVLPARLPLILLTASSGIAVGMATNIMPYNLIEVCDAVTALIDNPTITNEDLLTILPAPDYPLGGIVHNSIANEQILKSGRGSVKFKVSAAFEKQGKNSAIVLSNVPFQINKSDVIKDIAQNVRDGKIEGISEIRDESNKHGIRICIELKRGADQNAVLNQLYKLTKIQTSHSMNAVTIFGDKPKRVGLRTILDNFLKFRKDIIRRRTEAQKLKAERRLEIIDAMITAVGNRVKVINVIVNHDTPVEQLKTQFSLSQRQAEHIFNMPVRRFSKEDQNKLGAEKAEIQAKIATAQAILTNAAEVDRIIKEETTEIKKKFGKERKTELAKDFSILTAREMTKKQDVVLAFMSDGTVKSTPAEDYKLQRRKGTGSTGSNVPDGVYSIHVETLNSHDHVMLFTSKGNRYRIKAYDIPALGKGKKAQHIKRYIPAFKDDEEVVAVTKGELEKDEFLLILGSSGRIKRLGYYIVNHARDKTTMIYSIKKGGDVIGAVVAKVDDEIIVTTERAQVLKTKVKGIRAVKVRTGAGVKILPMKLGDNLLSISKAQTDGYILSITENGFGKRTPMDSFVTKSRYSTGTKGHRLSKGDKLVFSASVPKDSSESGLFVMTNKNKAIKMPFEDVRETSGRDSIGTQIKKMEDDERITTVSFE